MHETRSRQHFPAVRFRDALVPQTNAEDGNLFAEMDDDFFADTRFARRSWSWGNANMTRHQGRDLSDGDRVVSCNGQFKSKLAEILGQIVGERIVVIEKQKH